MSFMDRLHRAISNDERQAGRSQCFIGHAFRDRDMRVTLERALKTLGLSAYFADRELTSGPIINKVYKKIRVTRASIVDLTSANPNVYFELGVAVGLNKPVFAISRDTAAIPPLLEGFVHLHFSSYADLEKELLNKLPIWLNDSFGHDLPFSSHCNFVNVPCLERQRLDPQQRYLVIDQYDGGADPLALTRDPDLASRLLAILDPFQYTPVFLNDVPLGKGFRFCDYCRDLRDSTFAICHFTPRSSNTVYALFGLITGLGIPPLLLIPRERDYQGQFRWLRPSLLQGLDVLDYESYAEISERLNTGISSFLTECEQRQFKLRKQKTPVVKPWGTALEDVAFQLISEHDILSQLLAQRTQHNQAGTPPKLPPGPDTTYVANTATPIVPCADVRERLPEYATASALGSTPEQSYPEIAAHLTGCAACQEELAELIELTTGAYEGHLDPGSSYPAPNLAFLNRPAPKTKPEAGWFDEFGRFVIEFSQALLDTLRKPSLAGATRGQFLFRYVQEPGPLRVTIEAYTEDTIRQEGRVQVNVDIHSRDALEQQGIYVTLHMDTSTWMGETDEMGSVDFAPIPLAMLPRMRVEIAPAGMPGASPG